MNAVDKGRRRKSIAILEEQEELRQAVLEKERASTALKEQKKVETKELQQNLDGAFGELQELNKQLEDPSLLSQEREDTLSRREALMKTVMEWNIQKKVDKNHAEEEKELELDGNETSMMRGLEAERREKEVRMKTEALERRKTIIVEHAKKNAGVDMVGDQAIGHAAREKQARKQKWSQERRKEDEGRRKQKKELEEEIAQLTLTTTSDNASIPQKLEALQKLETTNAGLVQWEEQAIEIKQRREAEDNSVKLNKAEERVLRGLEARKSMIKKPNSVNNELRRQLSRKIEGDRDIVPMTVLQTTFDLFDTDSSKALGLREWTSLFRLILELRLIPETFTPLDGDLLYKKFLKAGESRMNFSTYMNALSYLAEKIKDDSDKDVLDIMQNWTRSLSDYLEIAADDWQGLRRKGSMSAKRARRGSIGFHLKKKNQQKDHSQMSDINLSSLSVQHSMFGSEWDDDSCSMDSFQWTDISPSNGSASPLNVSISMDPSTRSETSTPTGPTSTTSSRRRRMQESKPEGSTPQLPSLDIQAASPTTLSTSSTAAHPTAAETSTTHHCTAHTVPTSRQPTTINNYNVVSKNETSSSTTPPLNTCDDTHHVHNNNGSTTHRHLSPPLPQKTQNRVFGTSVETVYLPSTELQHAATIIQVNSVVGVSAVKPPPAKRKHTNVHLWKPHKRSASELPRKPPHIVHPEDKDALHQRTSIAPNVKHKNQKEFHHASSFMLRSLPNRHFGVQFQFALPKSTDENIATIAAALLNQLGHNHDNWSFQLLVADATTAHSRSPPARASTQQRVEADTAIGATTTTEVSETAGGAAAGGVGGGWSTTSSSVDTTTADGYQHYSFPAPHSRSSSPSPTYSSTHTTTNTHTSYTPHGRHEEGTKPSSQRHHHHTTQTLQFNVTSPPLHGKQGMYALWNMSQKLEALNTAFNIVPAGLHVYIDSSLYKCGGGHSSSNGNNTTHRPNVNSNPYCNPSSNSGNNPNSTYSKKRFLGVKHVCRNWLLFENMLDVLHPFDAMIDFCKIRAMFTHVHLETACEQILTAPSLQQLHSLIHPKQPISPITRRYQRPPVLSLHCFIPSPHTPTTQLPTETVSDPQHLNSNNSSRSTAESISGTTSTCTSVGPTTTCSSSSIVAADVCGISCEPMGTSRNPNVSFPHYFDFFYGDWSSFQFKQIGVWICIVILFVDNTYQYLGTSGRNQMYKHKECASSCGSLSSLKMVINKYHTLDNAPPVEALYDCFNTLIRVVPLYQMVRCNSVVKGLKPHLKVRDDTTTHTHNYNKQQEKEHWEHQPMYYLGDFSENTSSRITNSNTPPPPNNTIHCNNNTTSLQPGGGTAEGCQPKNHHQGKQHHLYTPPAAHCEPQQHCEAIPPIHNTSQAHTYSHTCNHYIIRPNSAVINQPSSTQQSNGMASQRKRRVGSAQPHHITPPIVASPATMCIGNEPGFLQPHFYPPTGQGSGFQNPSTLFEL